MCEEMRLVVSSPALAVKAVLCLCGYWLGRAVSHRTATTGLVRVN